MFSRLVRFVTSLGIVGAAYLAYWLVLAPWIEPAAKPRTEAAGHDDSFHIEFPCALVEPGCQEPLFNQLIGYILKRAVGIIWNIVRLAILFKVLFGENDVRLTRRTGV